MSDGRQGHGQQLPPDLALLFEALREEFNAKISNLKAWGLAMCLGGGTLGGIVTTLVAPSTTHQALAAVGRFLTRS